MTDVIKTCNHSISTLFCDVCNKVDDFEYTENNIIKNILNICLDENLGFGTTPKKKATSENPEVANKNTIDTFQLFASIINSLTNIRENNVDEELSKELDKRNIRLSMNEYFILKQLTLQKIRKEDNKNKENITNNKIYVDMIKAASSNFKTFINKVYKESNIPIYNISKTISESMSDITEFKKKIVLNSDIDYNQVNMNIHPLLVALFFDRIKGLDYQIIYGMPQRLISNLINNNFNFNVHNKSSQFDFHLLFNKLSMIDSNPFKDLKDFEDSEIEKIQFSNANRGDVLNVRTGNFSAITMTNKLYDHTSDDFVDYYIKKLDIFPLIYKNGHYSYIKIKIEAFTNNKDTTNIQNCAFKEEFNGNVIELVSSPFDSGNPMFKTFQGFNDNIINNGFLIYKVDRSKKNMRNIIMTNSLFGNWNSEYSDFDQYIDRTPIEMPNEIKLSNGRSNYRLKSVVGYYERNGKKLPGLYYTVIFTSIGNMFYYSNELLLFDDGLPMFLKGSDKNDSRNRLYSKQYFDVSDLFVKEERVSDMMNYIKRTAFLYVYDSMGHDFHIFQNNA